MLADLIRLTLAHTMFTPRFWNIALRTAHIAAMGVLLGGHAFDVAAPRLILALWCTVATGLALGFLEAGLRLVWFHQGRGLLTLAKLALVLSVVWLWDYRLPILLGVVVLASVGSHMSARFRYYSVLYGRVIPCGSGPGTAQLPEEVAEEGNADPDVGR